MVGGGGGAMTRVGLVGLCVCWMVALVSLDGQRWPAKARSALLPRGADEAPGPWDGVEDAPRPWDAAGAQVPVRVLALKQAAGAESEAEARALSEYLHQACPAFRGDALQSTVTAAP